MFRTLLIANRGEIACRVIKTARAMGVRAVAVYSDADAKARHVAMADTAVHIGPSPARESYLIPEKIIAAAKATGAEAIHPGYGFLSENAAFAEACAAAGLVFVGPPPAAIRAMGLKDAAKDLMARAGVPVVPGYHGADQDAHLLRQRADGIGYPVLIKAVAGGGGKGMRRVDKSEDFEKALAAAQREASSAFGDARVLVEKYVAQPRHIEIQVFADGHGNAVYLHERDCSLQRRHQKVIEEAPAPGMPPDVRRAMGEAAVKAARAIGYQGAGTVEFIVDSSKGLKADGFFFMEMNTRLQVEHPVTEMITGTDLVAWQLRVASGEKLPLTQAQIPLDGHAIEARLYAEDPAKGFLPSTGRLHRLRLAHEDAHVRIDTGVAEGDEVSMFYDPMIAKVIVWDRDRRAAAGRLAHVLQQTQVAGVRTNAAFLIECLRHEAFLKGEVDTSFIEKHGAALIPKTGMAPRRIVALAALAQLLEQRANAAAAEPRSPWALNDAFRIGRKGHGAVEFQMGGARIAVAVTYEASGYSLAFDGAAHVVSGDLTADGNLSAVIDGHHASAGVVWLTGSLVLNADGAAYAFDIADPLAIELEGETGAKDLRAPMPGRIVQVLAKTGERVKRGQSLVVLEAMKMEQTLAAPGDLTVAAVNVAPGDQTAEGAVLVTFAADAA